MNMLFISYYFFFIILKSVIAIEINNYFLKVLFINLTDYLRYPYLVDIHCITYGIQITIQLLISSFSIFVTTQLLNI